ncbi:GNAT family N-acetyltransferase [Mycobacterium kyogaense]|uniref:GNAT family N-acetyltransferase n=1 Tax=Mycobacterium kyogaense TaxID=2212479 RepID=UPI0013C4492C|nr:GNAT family N-acetyltransferase [Mycobacterium kyogaense]
MISEPGELSAAQLLAAEELVRSAFGSAFRSHDWLHAVDGVHIVISDSEQSLIGFAAVISRTLHHNDVSFDTGYIEGVAVRADQQGLGLGRAVMDHAEHIVSTRHQLGALNAVESAAAFYEARGWQRWTGHTQAAGPTGTIDTYDEADRIYLLSAETQGPPLTGDTALICDWRPGDLW